MYVFIFLFSSFSEKLVIRELQVLLITRFNIYWRSGKLIRVTQKDSIFLEEMTDIKMSTLKCPELSTKHLHACATSTERWRRRIIWKLLWRIDELCLIKCKYLPLRDTLKTLYIRYFISSLRWMSILIFPNIRTIFTCSK